MSVLEMFESNLGRVDDAQGGELGASVEIDLVISPSLLPSLYLDEIKEGKKRNVFFLFFSVVENDRGEARSLTTDGGDGQLSPLNMTISQSQSPARRSGGF